LYWHRIAYFVLMVPLRIYSHTHDSWGPKVHGAPNFLIEGLCPFPPAPPPMLVIL